MRTRSHRESARTDVGRVGVLVVACTVALTLSFLGVVAIATGAAVDPLDRLPAYVLVMAGAFAAGVVVLEESGADGPTVLATAVALGVAALALAALGVEGAMYAAEHPEEAVGSQLLFYLLAAALIATGLGYWGLRHWREVARRATPGSL